MLLDLYYKRTIRALLLLIGVLVLTRLTGGAFAVCMLVLGIVFALQRKLGLALCTYITFPLMVIINPYLLPKSSMLFGVSVRFAVPLIGLALLIGGISRPGRYNIPLLWMLPYLMVMAISSSTGWFPSISYMKLVVFCLFIFTLVWGVRGIQHSPKDVEMVRCFFFAVSIFFVLGSVVLLPFPNISTLAAMTKNTDITDDFGVAEAVAHSIEHGMSLFCGVTFQSQTLSPLVACIFGWVACDMLFVEKNIRWLHVLTLICIPLLLYKTRSRCGLLAFVVATTYISCILLKRVKIPRHIKDRAKRIVGMAFFLLLLVAVVVELRDNSMSKLIRKKNHVDTGNSMVEDFTSSRMGLIEKSMRDFELNPMLGMGFQVEERHRWRFAGHKGLILSATIEKGVLPVMVIGEGGVIGGVCFLIFLVAFYCVCAREKLYVTSCLMTVYIATNMAEATFFSPGGPGGIEWMLCVVGGFIIDMKLLQMPRLVYPMRLY